MPTAFQHAVEDRLHKVGIMEHVAPRGLAVALPIKAMEHGFRLAFFRLEGLLPVLKRDQDLPSGRLGAKKYMNVVLLVVAELGFQPLSPAEAGRFFRLVSYRYQTRSVLLTTNKPVKE